MATKRKSDSITTNEIVDINLSSSSSSSGASSSISEAMGSNSIGDNGLDCCAEMALKVLNNPDKGNCEFCYDELKAGEGVMLQTCLHLFCKDCLRAAVEQKDRITIPCPVADEKFCGGELTDAEVEEVVSPEVYREYIDRSLLVAKKKMKNVFTCKTNKCSGFCEFEEGRKTFTCPMCSETNCLECNTIHSGVSCDVYQTLIRSGDGQKLKELMAKEKQSGWRQLMESLKVDGEGEVSENGFITKNLVLNTGTFDCPICFVEIEKGQGVILQDCLHTFCRDCLIDHVKHNEEVQIKCPYIDDNYTCVCYLQACEIKALVPPDIYEKYLQRAVNIGEGTTENSYHCRSTNCPGWWEVVQGGEGSFFECPICKGRNCISCDTIHDGTCEDYKNTKEQAKNDQLSAAAVDDLIKQGTCMRCPKCKVPIFKTAGCDSVQCTLCRTLICWATKGPRWGPKGHGDISGGCRCMVNGKKCHPKCSNCH